MTKGDRAVDEGEGREAVEMSCREKESTREMDDPAGKARSPDGERSMDPKLFRVVGPGRVVLKGEESGGDCDGDDPAATDIVGGLQVGLLPWRFVDRRFLFNRCRKPKAK